MWHCTFCPKLQRGGLGPCRNRKTSEVGFKENVAPGRLQIPCGHWMFPVVGGRQLTRQLGAGVWSLGAALAKYPASYQPAEAS